MTWGVQYTKGRTGNFEDVVVSEVSIRPRVRVDLFPEHQVVGVQVDVRIDGLSYLAGSTNVIIVRMA